MPEQCTTSQNAEPLSPPLPLSLSPVQLAFLESLRRGPRPTSRCHDAITVGALMRLNLVAWHETMHRPRDRRGTGTFALTSAATQFLINRDGREPASQP